MNALDVLAGTVALARTDDLPRGKWLELRRAGLGGSDAAAVCGLDRWRSPFEVWADKTGLYADDDAAGEAARWGRLLEPVIAGQLPGVRALEIPWLLAAADHDWMLANVDRIAIDEDRGEGDMGVVEIKTTSPFQAAAWRDGVPPAPMCQVMHYLAVTGLGWAMVAALIGGQRLVVHRIERDDDLIADLVLLEERFWQSVRTKTPPDPDGSPSTTRLLGRLYDVDPGRVETVARVEVAEVITRARQARARRDAAQIDLDEAENVLKVRMGPAELLVDPDGDVIARWPEVRSNRINPSLLRLEYPAVAAEVTEPSVSRRFTLAKGGA